MISIKGHRVLIKVEKLTDADEVYKSAAKSGIVFAEDTEDSKRQRAGLDRGTVVAVGPDCWRAFYASAHPNDANFMSDFEPWAKIGDFVSFAKYSGKMLEDPEDGQKYMVVNDEDIVAVLRGAKNE